MNEFTRRPAEVDLQKYRIIGGQVYAWDDSPHEEFGQMWIPICVRCGNGPLGEGLLCEHCEAFPPVLDQTR